MNKKVITASVLLLGSVLFSGCSMSDYGEEDVGSSSYDYDDGGSTTSSSLSVKKSYNGFDIVWNKNNSGYSEVIYTDDLDRTRGRGYPLTSNSKGKFTMPCEYKYEDSDESYNSAVYYTCYPSNVTYKVGIKLVKGVEYKWLVSDGYDHTHGEVEFTMSYTSSGGLVID
jgi:hypothetical protein